MGNLKLIPVGKAFGFSVEVAADHKRWLRYAWPRCQEPADDETPEPLRQSGVMKEWPRDRLSVRVPLPAEVDPDQAIRHLQSLIHEIELARGLRPVRESDPEDSFAEVEMFLWQHGRLPTKEDDAAPDVQAALLAGAKQLMNKDRDKAPSRFNVASVLRYIARRWKKPEVACENRYRDDDKTDHWGKS